MLHYLVHKGALPFLASLPRDNSREEAILFWRKMEKLHKESSIPNFKSPLFPIIKRCLNKEPNQRYHSFFALRKELEILLNTYSGISFKPPVIEIFDKSDLSARGFSLQSLEKYEEAILLYNQSLEIDPTYLYALFNKGRCLLKLERYEEALVCLDKGLALDPHNSFALLDKGNTLGKMNRFEEAIFYYDKVADSLQDSDYTPNLVNAITNKGTILYKLDHYEKALLCFEKAISITPDYCDAWYGMAISYYMLRIHREAAASFQKYIDIADAEKKNKTIQYQEALRRLRELSLS